MRPAGWLPATTWFEVHNLAPAVGETVVAIGHAIRSKHSGLASADLFVMRGGAATLCATALATCRFFQIES
jgi:acyl-coenzyme A thioesterase PaaI-like protein